MPSKVTDVLVLNSVSRLIKKKIVLLDFLKHKNGIVGYINANTFNVLNLKKITNLPHFSFVFESFFAVRYFSFLLKENIEHLNVDFTGVAGDILSFCSKEGLPVVFIGGSEEEICSFESKMKVNYPLLKIDSIFNGYSLDIEEVLMFNKNKKVVYFVALGSPYQEDFSIHLFDASCVKPVIITCGGFISQVAGSNTKYHYPKLFRKPGLRGLYRVFTVRGMFKRVMIRYTSSYFEWVRFFIKNPSAFFKK